MRLSELEREAAARPAAAMAGVGAGAGANGGAGPGIGSGASAAGSTDPIRRQVEQLAESDPDRVAEQLRTWMQEG